LSFKYDVEDGLEPSLLSEEDVEFLETPFSNDKSLGLVRLLVTVELRLKNVFSFLPEQL